MNARSDTLAIAIHVQFGVVIDGFVLVRAPVPNRFGMPRHPVGAY